MQRRRRTASDHAVEAALGHVERGKDELVSAVPSARGVPGRPVADALLAFEDALLLARDALAAPTGDEPAVRACEAAIEESLRRAERLRLAAPALDYEGLVTVLADLMAPLDAFDEAEVRR